MIKIYGFMIEEDCQAWQWLAAGLFLSSSLALSFRPRLDSSAFSAIFLFASVPMKTE